MSVTLSPSKKYSTSRKALLIFGPTSSGKTELAEKIVLTTGQQIINADASQIYKDLTILTSRPAKNTAIKTKYHLYGHVSSDVRYSVGQYISEVAKILAKNNYNKPIFVGGTGLYHEILINGLRTAEPTNPNIHESLSQVWKKDKNILYEQLIKSDPKAKDIVNPNDRQRIIRRLAIIGNKKILADQPNSVPLLSKESYCLCLVPPREILYQRINSKVDEMVSKGGLEEVRNLLGGNLMEDLPIMKAIGVRHLKAYLEGYLDLSTAIELMKRDTRRYAKRQYTWIRGRCSSWRQLNPFDQLESKQAFDDIIKWYYSE